MAEYIEREELLEEFGEEPVIRMGFESEFQERLDWRRYRDIVKAKHAADVAPVVHGRWIQVICHEEFEDGFADRLYECCSRCHEPNGRKTSDYCPNCGARMDGDGNG